MSDHIKSIYDHVGEGVIDYCIYDTGEIVPEFVRKYNKEGSDLVEIDLQKSKSYGMKLMQRNLSDISGDYIRHNSDAIATAIMQLICDDLKFRDKQNDAQYMMLNNRIKDTKKQLKKNKPKKKTKVVKNKSERKSKFYNKYQDRITSIQESDKKNGKSKEKIEM